MKNMFEKNILLLAYIAVFLISYVILQICLFEKIIPYISIGEFKHLGLLEGDASIFHKYAIRLSDYLINSNYYDFFNNFFNFSSISLNIKMLSILYFLFDQDPIYLIILNSIYFLISIICIHKLSLLFFNKISYSKIFFISMGAFLLFFPSLVYSFNSSGKEAMIITFILIFLIIFISVVKDNYQISTIKLLGFTFIFFILYCYRPHLSYMIFILSVITLLFFMINLSKNKLIILNFIKLIFSMLLTYLLFTFISIDFLSTFNFIDKDIITEFKDLNNKSYIPYIPNFFEDLYNKIFSLRNHFIQHSLLAGSTNLISADIHSLNPINIFIYIPKLMFEGVLTPYPFTLSSNYNDLFLVLTNFEMIILYILYSSLLINFKNLKNYEFILITFVICVCAFLLFINPNIGSHYRLRQPFIIILIILSFKNWIFISENIYQKYVQDIYNLSNKFIYKFLENGLLNIFLILLFSLFIFFREIIFINYMGINSDISIYFLTITFLSIVANSLNIPLTDTLLTERKSDKKFITFEIINLFINLIFFIFVFIVLFILSAPSIFKLFNINYHLNFYYILVFSIVLISIPVNALFSSYLFFMNKSRITYSLQLIVPITSIITVYFFKEVLSLKHIFLSISLGIFLNSLLLIIISKINNFNYIIFSQFSIKRLKFIYFSKLFIISFSLFLINSFILISILFTSFNSLDEIPFVNISFRFTLLINALISSIITSMFLPLISVNTNPNKILFIKSSFFFILGFTILFSIISLSLDNLIYFFPDVIHNNLFSEKNISVIISILKLIPLTVIIGLLFKYFILIKKENLFLIITTFYLIIYLLFLLFTNNLNILSIINILTFIYTVYIISLILFIKINFNFKIIFILVALICSFSTFF